LTPREPKRVSSAARRPDCAARPRATPWRRVVVVDLALIAASTLTLLTWSWGKWADVMVDFGREIYVPWQLVEGRVLYRDIAYFNGPLSPHLNALWFRLFGVGLRTLALANLAILAAALALLYGILARMGSRLSALLGCLAFVLLFGFADYTTTGNYNYICPYSHEMTHGIVLALAAISFLGRLARGGRMRDAAACGACVGLVFLTKPEVFLALLLAVPVGLACALPPKRLAAGAFVSVGAALPPLASFALLSLQTTPREAALGTLGGLRWVLDRELAALPFYRSSMGLLDLAESVERIGLASCWYAVLFVPPAVLGLLWRHGRGGRSRNTATIVATAAVTAGVGIALFASRDRIAWADALRPLPLLLIAAAVVCGGRAARSRDRAALALPLVMVLFSLGLLAKMILNTRMYQYGFALAMPATLVGVVMLWDWLPRAIERAGGTGAMSRGALAAVLVVVAGLRLERTGERFEDKVVRVGRGPDALWYDDRGPGVNRALDAIDRHVPLDGTLAVVPEGAMLNYLARRRNPTPFVSFMPPEVIMFGEERMLEALRRAPPDFVLWTNRDAEEYGHAALGVGYGERLARWVQASYVAAEPPPPSGEPLRVLLLKRKPAPSPSGTP
jgi:hypothetical protein